MRLFAGKQHELDGGVLQVAYDCERKQVLLDMHVRLVLEFSFEALLELSLLIGQLDAVELFALEHRSLAAQAIQILVTILFFIIVAILCVLSELNGQITLNTVVAFLTTIFLLIIRFFSVSARFTCGVFVKVVPVSVSILLLFIFGCCVLSVFFWELGQLNETCEARCGFLTSRPSCRRLSFKRQFQVVLSERLGATHKVLNLVFNLALHLDVCLELVLLELNRLL